MMLETGVEPAHLSVIAVNLVIKIRAERLHPLGHSSLVVIKITRIEILKQRVGNLNPVHIRGQGYC